MVHVRLNEREANPNPHINFITPLPFGDTTTEEDARQLLRALAAQVKPVMRAHGFTVNSFEEYEHNKVFLGRNWNAGETVELVLRGSSGQFLPTYSLMSTLCHELAHIKHMNHGPAFQALWAQLRREVRELQSKGYYGDGYWSTGTRLADSARVGGDDIPDGDLPEYVCGGAHSRARPSFRRRRQRRPPGPSMHTGAQTAKRRKAGARVTAQGVFRGDGQALNADVEDEDAKKVGTGFGKKAASKRAREERALAAERRVLALQQKSAEPSSSSAKSEEEYDSDDGVEEHETDQDRRQAMFDTMSQGDADNLKASATAFANDFILPSAGPSNPRSRNLVDAAETACSVEILPHTGSTAASSGSQGKGKGRATEQSAAPKRAQSAISDFVRPESSRPSKKQKLSYGTLVEDEVKFRKKEALGMVGGGRTLGNSTSKPAFVASARPRSRLLDQPSESQTPSPAVVADQSPWTCLVCTLSNEPGHLACSACATHRGERSWSGVSV